MGTADQHNLLLKKAKSGDINAFHALFSEFKDALKSFIYRLLTNRQDAEDLLHDTFIKSFDKLNTFEGKSSLKTWIFAIATHLAQDFLKSAPRWKTDTHDQAKRLAHEQPSVMEHLFTINKHSPLGAYEVSEHIDYCFTCLTKTIPLNQQIVLILKDIYGFKVNEIVEILGDSRGVVKHLLEDARKTMRHVFDARCALVSKKGVCHQCSELRGVFNPAQKGQIELLQLQAEDLSEDASKKRLYEMRTLLVKSIDPLHASGLDLHEALLAICKQVNRVS